MGKPSKQTILILGGGKMGGALALRWQQSGIAVHVVEHDEARRAELAKSGIACHGTIGEATARFDAVILAIKPQQFTAARIDVTTHIGESTLVSIMAGITLDALRSITPHAVRVMPNLPAMIGESMSIGCAPSLEVGRRSLVAELFRHVGPFDWVEHEDKLHAVTAISGSGPAYLFAFMEALEAAAVAQGIAPELARLLVTQTMRGAALLADESVEDAATLRRNVTSPGGTTEAALAVFGDVLTRVTGEAVAAAVSRSKSLG